MTDSNENLAASLKPHFAELRNRILVFLLFFLGSVLLCYFYSLEIYDFLIEPLAKIHQRKPHKLIFTGLTEAFFVYLKLAFFGGFVFSFPVLAYQIYAFASPGLYKREKLLFVPYLIFSPVLFLVGGLIVYYYVMPIAWSFFISFEHLGDGDRMPIILEARISEYLSLVISLIVGFGVAFQLPLILILLTQIGLITGEWLASVRRYAIVVIFIAAAVLTPPDVVSQVALAIPLLLLYEISVLICKRLDRKKHYEND